MPGVNIRTATRSGPASPTVPESGRYFVVGQFERGPVTSAKLVRSFAEFTSIYGNRVAYGSAYDDLRTYFEEGGGEAVVARVVGPAATKGFLNLSDRAGTPLPTLKVEAIGAGTWSTGVTVQVRAGSNTGSYALIVSGPDGIVETYDNLTTPADAVYRTGGSVLVRVTDLGSATVAPNNIPAVLAATALSAGNDDRASITATTMGNALALFGSELGAGAVAIPGYTSALVGAALVNHAKANRRIALTATAVGATQADALSAADSLIGTFGGPDKGGDAVGLFYPWVRIPMGNGATKLISPEGYVAACRARVVMTSGEWEAPAGDVAASRFVVGTEVDITRGNGDLLDEGHVSAIRTIAGTVRLYGWRSLSTDADNFALLCGRDTLNRMGVEAERLLERHTFKSIDAKGQRFGSVAADLVGLAERYRVAGGLFEKIVDGQQIDPGYSVDVGPAVNTPALIAAGKVSAVLACRVSPVGTTVDLTIVKVALAGNV